MNTDWAKEVMDRMLDEMAEEIDDQIAASMPGLWRKVLILKPETPVKISTVEGGYLEVVTLDKSSAISVGAKGECEPHTIWGEKVKAQDEQFADVIYTIRHRGVYHRIKPEAGMTRGLRSGDLEAQLIACSLRDSRRRTLDENIASVLQLHAWALRHPWEVAVAVDLPSDWVVYEERGDHIAMQWLRWTPAIGLTEEALLPPEIFWEHFKRLDNETA